MVGERNVDDLSVALRVDAERLQVERELGVLQRAGWYSDGDRLALPLARHDRVLQLLVGRCRRGKALAGDQDVVPAAPPGNPDRVDAFVDGAYQMLARGVGNVELALIEREQRRRAVAKILDVVRQVIRLFHARQRGSQRAERPYLDTVTDCDLTASGRRR